jgi:hypothetical protein
VRRIPFLLLLILIAVPLFATQPQPTLVDDVIRMSKAGVPEESIITFIHKADGRFDVSANDMIAMTEAGVPKAVIKAVIDEADTRNGGSREAVRGRDTRDTRVVERVVVQPGYYPGYYYDPWYYDPFWYAPRFSLGVGFGFYRGGGHFHHGRR